MKVFFIGSVLFSREMLTELLNNCFVEIVGLATKSISNFNSDHTDLSDLAIKHKIPYRYVKDINSIETISWIQSLNPDIIFCFGWSSLIKKDLLNLTKNGVVGYHPAELPKNRGRHPIIWALVLGLEKTASTFFLMDEGADTGDIINQKTVEINFNYNAEDLYKKLIQVSKIQLREIIDSYANNSIKRVKQNHLEGNTWRKRSKEDGKIDWRMRSLDIYNLVRALYKPYPGAHFNYNGREIKVWKCEILNIDVSKNLEPGKVLYNEGQSIIVKTGDGAIKLTDHELSELDFNEYLL